jgi:hypothetical protein
MKGVVNYLAAQWFSSAVRPLAENWGVGNKKLQMSCCVVQVVEFQGPEFKPQNCPPPTIKKGKRSYRMQGNS